ncbi:cell division protein ZapD [Dickeya lacustris]|uniref:Cell division protein ZapD n=1 Tax=Dickeya lacustris TaxID=2259638 RepID=A0ABY8G4L2_9GAMM|nr:cell division protein ZapD [Dickeya lacustris]WFN54888.1 cell division protein ZapD [Dickeya lacustris]
MSDETPTVLFEYPLNEKMRTWLRLEFLLQQIYDNYELKDISVALVFFRAVAELLDILERGDVRPDLLKELERQQQKLAQWGELPEADILRINTLVHKLRNLSTELISAPRMGQSLREDKLISMVRQRLSLPSGCCSFDLPTLHIWLHQIPEVKLRQTYIWLESLTAMKRSLDTVLELIRQAGAFREQISLNSFYQDNASDADLLRLKIALEHQIYPQVSGHKTRFAIRFLPLESDQITPARFTFELACC